MRQAWALLSLCLVGCSAPAPESRAPAPVAPRALTDVVFERTPERVARGGYLVNGVLQCFRCHSERDWSQPGAPPVTGREGAGAVWWDKPWLVAPNLTPDVETGIGRRTDDMLARAIREGIAYDGRVLHPQMWSSSFRRLADEDLASVIVYLRSRDPVRNPLPPTAIPADVASELRPPDPITAPMPPSAADPVARGGYLAYVADCAGCHTSWYTPTNPGLFAGGNLIRHGDRQAWSSNITADPSGIPYYDAALFREVMRTGRVRARELSPLMPWTTFRHLSDEDLDALLAYLRAFTPAKHAIDNINPPTACAICGGTHPLGEYNRPSPFAPVPYRAADLGDVAGDYRFDDGWTVTIVRERQTLVAVIDGERCALETGDGRSFACAGGIDRFEFTRDTAGAVTGLVNNRTEHAGKVR